MKKKMKTYFVVLASATRLLLSLSLLSTVLSPPTTLAANILAFMPMPLKSHFGGFQPMFEELAQRGHNVTVVSSFPLKDRRVPNYTDVDVMPSGGVPGEYYIIIIYKYQYNINIIVLRIMSYLSVLCDLSVSSQARN